jgi:capsular exopolysaccharide synthesis family protein
MLALIAGLVLAAAAVVGADRFYDTVNTPEDLEAVGLAILGVVPAAPTKGSLNDLIRDPQSPIAEAYHSARTSLQFAIAGGTPKSILFTSARPSEGKTSSTIAIAADFVSIGKRVVVVDADLRKPSLQGESPGVSGILAGVSTLEQSLLPTEHPSLSLLPAGRIPPNPTALLTGDAFEHLIQALERQFDVVIIDGPPVMGFADAPLLSGVAQATVFIVASRSTSRSLARNAVARLQATGATLIGGILTKFERKSAAFSYAHASYGYDYQYGGHSQKRALIAPATHDIKEAAE